MENPTLKEVARNGVADSLGLQKYLLATGNLKDSIQDSLDMIVKDDEFNDANVRCALDLKISSVMKKNPINVVFKAKDVVAKLDTQNLVVC